MNEIARPWFDPTIDNPGYNDGFLRFAEDRTRQLSMERLLRQTQEVPTAKKEHRKPQGYIPFSPSDVELMATFDAVPDFDFANPDLTFLTPSPAMIRGQLRGIEGHFIDNVLVDLIRYYGKHRNQRSHASRLPDTLLDDSQDLEPHERAAINAAAMPVLSRYRSYSLRDIPTIVDQIRMQWRAMLVFNKRFIRQKTSPHAMKTSGRKNIPFTYGWAYSADELYELWNDTEVYEPWICALIGSQEQMIHAYLTEDLFDGGSDQFPLETFIERKCASEKVIRHKVTYDDRTDGTPVRAIQHVIADYLVWRSAKIGGFTSAVFDTKYERWKDTPAQMIQRYMYCTAADAYFGEDGRGRQQNPMNEFADLGIPHTTFSYRVYGEDDTGRLGFRYIHKPIQPEMVDAIKEELNCRAVQWASNYPDYLRVKQIKKMAAVMPYIPRPTAECTDVQARLFV